MSDLSEILCRSVKRARKGGVGGGSAWHCPECERYRGVAVRSMLHRIVVGASITDSGHVIGGQELYACWHCMARGQMTIAGKALDSLPPVM